MKKKAVVLLSGGLDSATTLFIARSKGYECLPLVFDYGQRHKREIGCAGKVAKAAGCGCKMLKIELPWKGSSLLDKKSALPAGRSPGEMKRGIPSSYVPARNTVFLSFALSYAEAAGAEKIFIGANSLDFSGYPDCRAPFLKAFEKAAREGTRAGQKKKAPSIEAPLLSKTKAQIIEAGLALKVPYAKTWSCYKGAKEPCGRCDSCILRKKGFEEAGVEDPLTDHGR